MAFCGNFISSAMVHIYSVAGITRVAVVGDVHELWDDDDLAALDALQPDAVLLVGDFGEEVRDL